MATRMFSLLVIGFALVSITANPVGRSDAAPVCSPGWVVVAEYNNSFRWEDVPSTSVAWTGSVRLLENLDAECYVQQVVAEFTGPGPGGTLSLSGYKIGVSYSIQYPDPFDAYRNVSVNSYGDALSWNPDGYYLLFYAHVHFDQNPRLADEYFIGTLVLGDDPAPGAPTPAVIPNVHASFNLPLELVGQTVLAQLHVYPDLCQCIVTAIPIPGTVRPPVP